MPFPTLGAAVTSSGHLVDTLSVTNTTGVSIDALVIVTTSREFAGLEFPSWRLSSTADQASISPPRESFSGTSIRPIKVLTSVAKGVRNGDSVTITTTGPLVDEVSLILMSAADLVSAEGGAVSTYTAAGGDVLSVPGVTYTSTNNTLISILAGQTGPTDGSSPVPLVFVVTDSPRVAVYYRGVSDTPGSLADDAFFASVYPGVASNTDVLALTMVLTDNVPPVSPVPLDGPGFEYSPRWCQILETL